MRNYLLMGDSHLVALVDAARRLAPPVERPAEPGPFQVHEFVLEAQQAHLVFIIPLADAPFLTETQAGGGSALSQPYIDQFRAALQCFGSGTLQVCSYFFGNEHSTFSIAEHPVPFDFFRSPDDEPCDGGSPRQIVPLSVIERRLTDLTGRTEWYCRVLNMAFAGQRALHILPPPPIADAAQVLGNPEIFGSLFARHPLAPALLRKKVYTEFCRITRARLEAAGVTVIGAPEAACEDGYLAQPYWRESTHANELYGELILRELGVL